jgi:lipid-binding SYLF domain-containing protein
MTTRRLAGLLVAWTAALATAEAQSDEADRIRAAAVVLDEIMKAPDRAIPGSVLARSEAIAIFPGTVRGGFIFGAERGRGIISARARGSDMWSPPAFLTITGGSFGLQIGLRSTDLVLVVQNRRGLENLVRNEFKIGAGAAATAGPVGRDAQAATDIQLRAEILSYSRSRGLFAGATLEGATIREDREANARFYGERYTTREVVADRKVRAPAAVAIWHEALKKYIR